MVIAGTFKDSALSLEGEMHVSDGRSLRQRITWQTEKDGVRESAVISKDGGKTCEPAFDILFRKHH